jgi:uncharacterized membrane protein YqjE
MADETAPSRSRPRQTGLLGSLIALASALADFFESRAALLATESKSALFQFLVAASCLVAAVLFFVFGYIFLLGSAVVAIAHMANVSWVWIALGAGGLHFVIALIFLIVAVTGIKRPVFRETRAELQKDREWLKNLEENRPQN